jgi:hypothetical protein
MNKSERNKADLMLDAAVLKNMSREIARMQRKWRRLSTPKTMLEQLESSKREIDWAALRLANLADHGI